MQRLCLTLTKLIFAISLFGINGLMNIAKADYLYTYTGNTFQGTWSVLTQITDTYWDYVYTNYDTFLNVEIYTPSKLTPDASIDDVTSLKMYYTYMDEFGTGIDPGIIYPGPIPYNHDAPNGSLAIGAVDANNLPTEWNISLSQYGFYGGRGHYMEMTTTHLSDTVSRYHEPFAGFAGALNNDPGNWQVALVSPVPEPETYGMLLVGLGFLAGITRRRSYKRKF
jgi:hypothetical protein